MELTELDKQYHQVSVELSNPFTSLSNFTKSKLRDFSKGVTESVNNAFKGVEVEHHNGVFNSFKETDKQLAEKKLVYMDFVPLQVFVPSYLKPKTQMLPYMTLLVEQMNLCADIAKHVTAELSGIVDGYLGNPKRLQDPNLVVLNTPVETSLPSLFKRMEDLNVLSSKLIVQDTTNSSRKFSEVYSKLSDWRDANTKAVKVCDTYVELIRNFDRMNANIIRMNERTAKLIDLIADDKHKTTGAVAGYIGNSIYMHAKLMEYCGASLVAAQVALKAMTDTNYVVQRALQ